MQYVPLSKTKQAASYTPLSKQSPDVQEEIKKASLPPAAPAPAPIAPAPSPKPILATTVPTAKPLPPIGIAKPFNPAEGTGSILRAPTAEESKRIPVIKPAETVARAQQAQENLGMSPGVPVYLPFGGKAVLPEGGLTGVTKITAEFPERLTNDVRDVIDILDTGTTKKDKRVPSFVDDAIGMYEAAQEAGYEGNAAKAIATLYGVGAGIFDATIAADLFGKGATAIVKSTAPDLEAIAAWQTLGKPKTLAEAETAYKQLSRQFHPDVAGGSDAIQARLNDAMAQLRERGIPSDVKAAINKAFTPFANDLEVAASKIEEARVPQKELPAPGAAPAEAAPKIVKPQEFKPLSEGGAFPEGPKGAPMTHTEAGLRYQNEVIAPNRGTGPTIISADNMKDHFGRDYDDLRHPIYSKAAMDTYSLELQVNSNPQVILTGGGPGAGKTEFITKQMEQQGFDGIIYDSNMSSLDGAKKQIDLAKKAGKEVQIYGITPDLGVARTHTILREEKLGRGISDKTFARGHAGFPRVAKQLLDEGLIKPEQIHILDTRGVTTAQAALDKIAKGDYVKDPVAYLNELQYNEDELRITYGKETFQKTRSQLSTDAGSGSRPVSVPRGERPNNGKALDEQGAGAKVYEGPLAEGAEGGVKKYPTIHLGGKIKMVQGEPVTIVDGVETFLHKGDGGWIVSEASTGRFLAESRTKEGAIAKAKFNINKVGKKKFQELLKKHKISGTQKDIVKKAVAEGPKSIKQVAEETKILEPNVRRILGVGAKDGTFERVDNGVYVLKKDGKDIAFIHTGDAVDTLPKLAAEGFKSDMVFLDIPYDTPAVKGGNRGVKYDLVSVAQFKTVVKAVSEITRTDNAPVFYMFSQAKSGLIKMQQYTKVLLDAGFKPVARGGYTKLQQDGITQVRNMRGNIVEPEGIILFSKSGKIDFEAQDLNFKLVRPKGYQTEKPAELLRSLIKMSTNEGEIVLDPFAGSGVTGAEAVKAGRKAVLIEKNPEVVEKVIKPRIEAAAGNIPSISMKSQALAGIDVSGMGIIPLELIISKFNRTGTATIAEGAGKRISIKDEGDYVKVGMDYGAGKLVSTNRKLPERVFATKEEAFSAVEELLQRAKEEARATYREAAREMSEAAFDKGDTAAFNAAQQKMIEANKIFRPSKASVGGGELGFNPKNLEEPSSAAAKKEVAKVIKRSEIARELSKKLDVPIRRGKFRKPGAIGIYKPTEDLIRIKSGGLYTIFHEVGHFIDDNVGALSSSIVRDEIEPLLVDYSAKVLNKNLKAQSKEAFAEFVRLYYMKPEEALKRAPKFFKYYEKKLEEMPEIRDAMATAAEDYKRWTEMPATAKVLSQLSIGADTAKVGFVERMANRYHTLYESAIDDLHPLDEFVKLAKKIGAIPAEENPYILARNLRGWTGKATTFLEKGTFGLKYWKQEKGKVVPKMDGKPFKEIVQPIEVKGNLDNLRVYLTAKRAILLADRKIVTGITRADAEAALKELGEKHPEFEGVAKELMKYQDALVKYAQEAGILSSDALEQMRAASEFYVPFYRVMEELETRGYMGRGIGNLSKQVRKIKGSEREIIDPLESIVKNTYSLINAAERNQVALAMIRLSKMSPELGRLMEKVPVDMKPVTVNVGEVLDKALGPLSGMLPEELKDKMVTLFQPSFFQKGGNIINVMVDGKPQYFTLDGDLFKAIQGLEQENVALVIKLLSMPAKFLRAGATLTPEFMLRNPARDLFSAYVYSKYGFMPIVDTARGIFSLFKKDDAYWLWRLGGGEHAMMVSLDREYLQKNLKEILQSKGQAMLKYIKNPIEALRIVSELGEAATRLGEMNAALRKMKNPIEAAFASREVTLDFARVGAKTRAVNMLIAFWNAQVQGMDKMVRAFRDRPWQTTAKTFTGITLPSILLYLANRDDPRWKEIPQWQKNLFWIIITDDNIYRIPKPFELGIIFGSVPERILEYIDTNDSELFEELKNAVLSGATPGFVPTALLPIIENTANYSFFLEAPIVPDSTQGLPVEQQYTRGTSEISKELGDVLSYSPAKLDNLIRGYFGGLGVYAQKMVDGIIKGTGITNPVTKPAQRLGDLPLIKGFVINEPIGSSSESVNRFYERYSEATAGAAFVKKLIDTDQKEKAQEYVAEHPEVLLATQYRQVADALSEIRKAESAIENSRTLSAEEKRAKLTALDKLITDIAAKALTMKRK